MKYKDGYIADYEMLGQMTVKELEDTLMRITDDVYLSEDAKRELVKMYLDERKWKLDREFVFTEENVRQMNEMNKLFEKQTAEVMHLAHQIFLDEMEVRRKTPDGYNHLEVRAELLIPYNEYGAEEESVAGLDTERDEMLWGMLGSRGINWMLDSFRLLAESDATFTTVNCDVERMIVEALYGFLKNGEVDRYSWISFREESDRGKVKDICFVRPFHNLYDFCGFSMQDILKIKQFRLNVEMVYENI